jgi:uncharacterized protein
MAVQQFAVERLPAMPWKNGGGVTREIVCVPAGAGLDQFDWRVSIASIAASGPFSAFPGIDRVITLLQGGGVHLRSRDGAIDHRLATPLAPFAFSGEAAIDAQLLAGECRDLNVMTRRGRCRAEVLVQRAAGELAPSSAGVVLAAAGRWHVASEQGAHDIAAGEGLWWQREDAAWRLRPNESGAALIAILVRAST